MLFGFVPKLVIWVNVDAGIEEIPGGAVPVEDGEDDVVVVGTAVSGRHWLWYGPK